ncbi:unnamed protein product [Microthlaspi erraticum]|uniref:Uncharacterized protein n=1 Tax=Microthlaspi erraticum TaxID=1685480 RepID=A0A6D2KDA2_9BRAS|nr:unnamed protein product [Microthlaspi erraticum]
MEDEKNGYLGAKKGFEGGATVTFREDKKTHRTSYSGGRGRSDGNALVGKICYFNTQSGNFTIDSVTSTNALGDVFLEHEYYSSNLNCIVDEKVLSPIALDPKPEHQLSMEDVNMEDVDKVKVGSDTLEGLRSLLIADCGQIS